MGGVSAINYQEITAWLNIQGITDREERVLYCQRVMYLERLFFEYIADNKADKKPRGTDANTPASN